MILYYNLFIYEYFDQYVFVILNFLVSWKSMISIIGQMT